MADAWPPTLAAALARIEAVRPGECARTRNAIDGAVTGLSPYITHRLVSLPVQHKFVQELGWRAYFRHVWEHRGDGILQSLHEGPLADAADASALPADIREGRTGVPVIDRAVRDLYATGMLHNHARMWLASDIVHVRKVHWRVGADWLYAHWLDGDLASNHLSWQRVAGTGSVIDTSYEALDRVARNATPLATAAVQGPSRMEPPLLGMPPRDVGATAVAPALVAGQEVWLVHPWSLGPLPELPADGLVLGVFVDEFHRAWPWSERCWRFVGTRMAERAAHRWHGDAAAIGAALAGARHVGCIEEPHLAPWLARWAARRKAPALCPHVATRCASFSQWWSRASRSLRTAADLLALDQATTP
jgi:deoxyribodipyrimidine photo-lyase